MVNTKIDFEQRKKEVENYFSFLEILDKETTSIKYIKDHQYVEEMASKDIQRILIANSFLILYNLVEATIRNSIIEIYDKIQEDSVSYNQLSASLKKIWIKSKTKSLKESNFNISTLHSNVESIINNVITGSVLSPFMRMEDETDLDLTKDLHFVDVSFSPQNEINKDIIAEYGNNINLDNLIGDPRDSYETGYQDLIALNPKLNVFCE